VGGQVQRKFQEKRRKGSRLQITSEEKNGKVVRITAPASEHFTPAPEGVSRGNKEEGRIRSSLKFRKTGRGVEENRRVKKKSRHN